LRHLVAGEFSGFITIEQKDLFKVLTIVSVELAANNLKTATKKVDTSAAAVEVALKVLTAA
jgi:hypothetical protein